MLRVLGNDRHWRYGSRPRLFCGNLLGSDCIQFRLCHFHRLFDRYFPGLLGLQPRFEIAQHAQTGFGVVQHVPGLTPAGFDCLHVILDADDGIGHAIRFFLSKPAWAAALQCQINKAADAIHNVHRTSLVQHHQPSLDTAYQCRNTVEPLRVAARCQALTDRLLDSRKIDDALAHHSFGYESVVGVLLFRQLLRLFTMNGFFGDDQIDELLVKSILDPKQRRCDLDNGLLAG